MFNSKFKSLYPSEMGENNIAPNTQIGKIEIDEVVYKGENAYRVEEGKYSRGGEFIENMVTDNYIEFCHRWFHLASISEFIHDMDEYFGKIFGTFSNIIKSGYNGIAHIPIIPTSKGPKSVLRFNQNKIRNPILFYNNRNEKYNYNELSKRKEDK